MSAAISAPISSWCQNITRPCSSTRGATGLPMSCSSTAQASGTSGATPGRPRLRRRSEEPLAAQLRDHAAQCSSASSVCSKTSRW